MSSSRPANKRRSAPPPRKRRGSFLITLIKLGFAALLLWMLIGVLYYLWALTFDLSTIGQMPQRSAIYDRTGTFYSRTMGENRVVVPFDGVSPNFVKALISREDSRFYEHRGIDPLGIARAAVRNLLFGGMKEGASTITQQLARNSFPLGGKTFNRKFLEAAMAFRIEMEMTKEKILELYMNRIYFGSGLYGVETASQAYFGKPAADMSLSEAALLAGLIRSPNRYSPFNNLEASLRQRNVVLGRMEELELITHAEHEKALREKIAPRQRQLVNPLNSWAVDAILHELEQVVSPSKIDEGGLRIDTSIDAGMQQAAEQSLARRLAEVEARPDFRQQHAPPKPPKPAKGKGKEMNVTPATPAEPPEPLQAALLAIDNASGGITAIVGGRNFAESKYNRALVATRQIGSSAKPFVYEEAFRKGVITPETPVSDARLSITELPPRSPAYDPQNSDGTFGGDLPAKEGLIHSRNTMSVRVGLATGLGTVASIMEKLGLAEDVPRYPSICLGSFESTLRNVTVAYSALATGGSRLHPHLIEQVTDAEGKVLFRATRDRIPVLDRNAARATTAILTEVFTRGTASRAASLGLRKPAAGKTGTTDRFVDAWFLGYTEGLTCGVWVGFDHPKTIMRGGYGAELALPIWVDVMQSPAANRFAAGPLP
ncbi:MAG: transglycosylase domain-containing protein [Chthoniobacterales bacterium]